MAEGEVRRRLAAIVAADVAEYSRLVSEDEEGTYGALRAHRSELIDVKIAEYHGRIANTAGDSILIEFPSVVDALRYSIDVQRGMTDRNADIPQDRRIEFRVGINLGDVIEEDGDLLGDGVNVAARLEGLAEPGGICISRAARDQVRDRMDVTLEDMGEIEVKNIARPVRAFRVVLERGKASSAQLPAFRKRIPALIAALVVAFAAGVGLWWWQPWKPVVDPVDPSKLALPLPEKPSIAVLPFSNFSNDPEQEPFVDGLTDNVLGTLSKIRGLFVISRHSMFTYKGKSVTVKQVAEELGVRFVLEGSVQRSGDNVRVTVQLIDAFSGDHVWAENYNRRVDEIFAVQDDISRHIAAALDVELAEGPQAREWGTQTTNLEAYELFLRGHELLRHHTKPEVAEAQKLLHRAVELDPNFSIARAMLGSTYYAQARRHWVADRDAGFRTADEYIGGVLEQDPNNVDALYILSLLRRAQGKWDESVDLAKRAVDSDPNNALAVAVYAWILVQAGHPGESLGHIKQAMRLSPYYPTWYHNSAGHAYRLMGDYENAILQFRAYTHRHDRMPNHMFLAMTLIEAGREEEAKRLVADARERHPGYTLKDFRNQLDFKDPEVEQRMIDLVKQAGLPESVQ